MRGSFFERYESLSAAEVAHATRNHLDGLRRGLLFFMALGLAIILFVGAGRRAAVDSAAPLTMAAQLCSGYGIPCSPAP
jgi:hypothetical protein